jgi:hypothetical protein
MQAHAEPFSTEWREVLEAKLLESFPSVSSIVFIEKLPISVSTLDTCMHVMVQGGSKGLALWGSPAARMLRLGSD